MPCPGCQGGMYCYCDTLDENAMWDCAFPGECCMPGPHMREECHTAEMIYEYFEELREANEEQGDV